MGGASKKCDSERCVAGLFEALSPKQAGEPSVSSAHLVDLMSRQSEALPLATKFGER
jgi:hypothetical protein